MVEKALASEADAVFLDLEDAVAPDSKAAARGDVVSALEELDWRGRPGLFRANALDTPYFYRDLIEVVEEAGDSLDAVMIPKVNRPEDLHAVSILLSQLELAMDLEKGKIKLEAQIESAEGLANVDSIARATDRLDGPPLRSRRLRCQHAHAPDEYRRDGRVGRSVSWPPLPLRHAAHRRGGPRRRDCASSTAPSPTTATRRGCAGAA